MSYKVYFKRGFVLVVLFFLCDFVISTVLMEGLNRYYGINKEPDVLINGSSMVMNGFDRDEMKLQTGLKVATYTHEGVGIDEQLIMLTHFFESYPNTVKKVIFEVSPVTFASNSLSANVYTIFYPFMDNLSIDEYIKNQTTIGDYLVRKYIRTSRFEARSLMNVFRGFMGVFESFKSNELDPVLIENSEIRSVEMAEEKIKLFLEAMELIELNNTDAILVMMPMYKTKLNSYTNESYVRLTSVFNDFCENRDGFVFLDLNNEYISSNHSNFFDVLHLNTNGQKKVTNYISNYILEQEKRSRRD